jgi:hypothetical protein
MIRRKLLIATAIIAAVVITACSDITAPKKLVPGGLPEAAMLAPHSAAAKTAAVFARINGGGTAEMQPPLAAGTTHWGAGVTLYSDYTASGSFDCVDQHGDAPGFAGNIWGEVTSWRMEGTVVVLNVVGKTVSFPGGHPQDVKFTVKIQQFGGAGVGRWTLEIDGFIYCYELLTSGQIVYKPE